MEELLISLFSFGYSIRIQQSDVYNMTEIMVVDDKLGKAATQLLPTDNHLNYSLAGAVNYCKSKLLEGKWDKIVPPVTRQYILESTPPNQFPEATC